MKYFLILTLLTLLSGQSLYAKTILLCLGKEESYYAKKHYTGPKYYLNQIMINEISSVGNPELAAGNYKKYCSEPSQAPSLKLLKAMNMGVKNLFDFKEEKDDANIQFAMTTYREFREKSVKVLIQYIAKLQIQAGEPKCLTENIPGLKEFYARYRYLEGDIDAISLKGPREDLGRLYHSLENIDKIFEKCKKLNKK